MPKEKKAKVDVEGLSAFISKWLIINGIAAIICHFVLEIAEAAEVVKAILPSSIVFVGAMVILVGAQKFDHN